MYTGIWYIWKRGGRRGGEALWVIFFSCDEAYYFFLHYMSPILHNQPEWSILYNFIWMQNFWLWFLKMFCFSLFMRTTNSILRFNIHLSQHFQTLKCFRLSKFYTTTKITLSTDLLVQLLFNTILHL